MDEILFYGLRGAGKTTYISMIYYYYSVKMSGEEINDIVFEDKESKEIIELYKEKIKLVERGEKNKIDIPPTNKKNKIRLRIKTSKGREYSVSFLDYKGEIFESKNYEIIEEANKSNQIVFIIDSKEYSSSEEEKKKVNSLIETFLEKISEKNKIITILMSKYDLVSEKFDDYRDKYLNDLEEILDHSDSEYEIMPVSCFSYKNGKVELIPYNLEESLLKILSRSKVKNIKETKETNQYSKITENKKPEKSNQKNNKSKKVSLSLLIIFSVAVAAGIIGFVVFNKPNSNLTISINEEYSKLIETKNIDLIPDLINKINNYSKDNKLNYSLKNKLTQLTQWNREINYILANYEDYKNGSDNRDALVSKINDFESKFGKVKKFEDIKKEINTKKIEIGIKKMPKEIEKDYDSLRNKNELTVSEINSLINKMKDYDSKYNRNDFKIYIENLNDLKEIISDYDTIVNSGSEEDVDSMLNKLRRFETKSIKPFVFVNNILKSLSDFKNELNSINLSYEDYKNGSDNGDALISKINDFESKFGKVKKLDDIKEKVLKYTAEKKTISELYSEVSSTHDIDLLKTLYDDVKNYNGPKDPKFTTINTVINLWYKRYEAYSKYLNIYNLWKNKDYFNMEYSLEKFVSTYDKENPYLNSANIMLKFIKGLENDPSILLDRIEINFIEEKTHGAHGDWAPDTIVFINDKQINKNKITGFKVSVPVGQKYCLTSDNTIDFKSEDKNWKLQTILTNLGNAHFGGKNFLNNILKNNMEYSTSIISKERGKTGTAVLKFKINIPNVVAPLKDRIFNRG